MNTTRLGRVAREALLLIRKFMGQGDFYNASEAALKAAEAFKEIAKHSTGSAHKIAYKRAKILVEITKVLRRGESLPIDLVEALDSFYPISTRPSTLDSGESQPSPTSEEAPPESLISTTNDEGVQEEEHIELTQHQLLNGIAIACKVVEMLDRASQSIRIMVQNLTDVKTITVGTESCEVNLIDRLVSKSQDGVMVRIIIREPEAFGATSKHFQEAVEKLLQDSSTIEILVCAQMHIKALIIDGTEVLEGSANFTAKGLSGIGEQATSTNNFEFVSQFVDRFDQYWVHQSSECTTCKNRTCEVHPLTRRIQ
ncbi:MAG: phospholipase D-like domain-containing protein [Promethearchaeota archaeon]